MNWSLVDDAPAHPTADNQRAIHEMRAALTLIRAHAQMNRRWLLREHRGAADREIMRMSQIDTFVLRLARQLDTLEDQKPPAN